ncbi:MAG TPA: LamG-like jellyroll fold domain-containing protein [Polyangia bacterium]|nr:LamG-like jellyroll fold domain-containing protein [Polyangia bacterium]
MNHRLMFVAGMSWLAGACSASSPGGGTGGAAGSAATGGAPGTGGLAGRGGASGAGGAGGAGGMAASCSSPSTYDQMILCDQPVAYWAMRASGPREPDLAGSNDGTYEGTAPTTIKLPNDDDAADFDGATGYLTIPSSARLSVPTTHSLTWEGWINADTLQFPHASSDGYVDWMGKCADYSPTCEWEARMYSATTSESRPNRMSAYIFNNSAGLGSAADWQPVDNLIKAGTWYHVVGEYTTLSAPSDCQSTSMYPGSINVWVNGVEWDQGEHGQTGCMSQYNVIPTAAGSPLTIGTMAMDTWFPGAVGKVAVYDRLLTPAQIAAHYHAMTGQSPTGSCGATCSFLNDWRRAPVRSARGSRASASRALPRSRCNWTNRRGRRCCWRPT